MLTVFAFATPNSIKVLIALEELGLPYELKSINVKTGEQKNPEFLALNANGKVPVLVEKLSNGEQFVLTESAAILVYLAEKNHALLPSDGAARARVFEQLFFHASALSPAFGQSGFFKKMAAEKMPIAIDRFHGEANRTLKLLDQVLSKQAFVAGKEFSIADIAHFGWIWRKAFAEVDFSETPNVARWYAEMEARPAVQRAINRANALVPA